MRASIAAALCLPLLLTGCTLTNTGGPSPVQGAELRGSVHGGQQPIAGAHVYLFAANTTGYGGAGIARSSSNASISLLNAASTGHSDSVGAYVLTDANGNFSISGDYTCTPGQQVYLYALGGNPGGGTNSHAGLMAALGNCPAAGNFLGTVSFINVNELTTVATAYAAAGFATDATHISSSGSSQAQTGIQNAFANAANLANVASGTAATNTAGNNGTPPTSEINTLGNILAACINTADGGSISAGCSTLFTNATADGTSTGTQPTDTATAAINIAHNPGANVSTLYGLITAQAPFSPMLASTPNDWTVGIQFNEGGTGDCTTGACQPYAIAVDGSGNVWAANNGSAVGAVAELGPDGTRKSPAAGFTDGTPSVFEGIVVDLNGNVWVPVFGSNALVEFSGATGSVLTSPGGIIGGGLNSPYAVAVDGSNNLWITNKNGNSLSEYSITGASWVSSTGYSGASFSAPVSVAVDHSGNAWVADSNNSYITKEGPAGASQNSVPPGTGGLNAPLGVAIDSANDVWITSSGGFGTANITELDSTGASLSGFSGFGAGTNTGGINTPQCIAIDGAGNAWVGDQSATTIAEFQKNTPTFSGGGAISPNTGYVVPGIVAQTKAIAIDPSGNVWLADPNSPNYLTEMIGAAAPVVTPLAVAAKNNTYGTRP